MKKAKLYHHTIYGILVPAYVLFLISAYAKAGNFAPQKSKSGSTEITHTVKKGETLFSISKKYKVTPADIRKWNKLKGNNIGVGQKLVVGYSKKKKAEAESKIKAKPAPVIKPLPESKKAQPLPPEKKIEPKRSYEKKPVWIDAPMKDVSEEGMASWIDDDTEGKYYALHRTAPVGTIIKVTNTANQKFVYVKVVGKIPAREEYSVIILQVSRSASEKLEANDARFNAMLNYSVPE
jgi:LysM repeat protein